MKIQYQPVAETLRGANIRPDQLIIVSMYPCALYAERPFSAVTRGQDGFSSITVFAIPAVPRDAEPLYIPIRDTYYQVEHEPGPNADFRDQPVQGLSVAADLQERWCLDKDYVRGEEKPAVFTHRGTPAAAVLQREMDGMLRWMSRIVRTYDGIFARNRGIQIPQIARVAANYLKLDREWNKTQTIFEFKTCIFCGTTIGQHVLKCPQCHEPQPGYAEMKARVEKMALAGGSTGSTGPASPAGPAVDLDPDGPTPEEIIKAAQIDAQMSPAGSAANAPSRGKR